MNRCRVAMQAFTFQCVRLATARSVRPAHAVGGLLVAAASTFRVAGTTSASKSVMETTKRRIAMNDLSSAGKLAQYSMLGAARLGHSAGVPRGGKRERACETPL